MSNFNSRDGYITERELARCQVIARTGCGIITNQGAYPDPRGEGKGYYRQIAIYDDKFIPQLAKVADMIHASGAVAIQQILHAGRYGGIDLGYCVQPSAVPQTLPHFRPPREMTKEEIKQTIKEFAAAAKRAIKAGFDGVEITSFVGYLLANFLSKFTNKRTDEYGGSVENRARFMVETIAAIKEAIGDHVLCVRLNGTELMDEFGGNTEEECLEMIRIAAETGGVDMISLVIGWQESRHSSIGRDVPPGHWNYLAERAKKVAGKVPVAFGVRVPDAAMADAAIAAGQFDFWEVCRPFLADPDRLHKYAEGREEEIKPCIGCLLCLSRLFRFLPYLCTVNPILGHEVEPEYHLRPAAVKKKVIVIGAGPAGLECALAAAQRGHDVTLVEREEEIGGQLRLLARHDLANKEDLQALVNYYKTMLAKLQIKLQLGTEIKGAEFRKKYGDVDVAVVATGAGLDLSAYQVEDGARFVSAHEVMADRVELGEKVVVLGGGKIGLCTAEYLAQAGKKVTVVEEESRIAQDVMPTFKWRHTAWTQELGIQVLTKVKVKAIRQGGVSIVREDGTETMLEADAVVCAAPRKARQEMLSDLEFSVDELYFVGDAASPRGLYQAIHEGYRLGVRI